MRPLIGLTTYGEFLKLGIGDVYAAALTMTYVKAVHASGGRAILITEDDPGTDVLDVLDGMVLTGGADVQPALYGQEEHERTYTRPARDASEMMLLRAALERDLPLLAICRGMQLMTVAYGGWLYQHLPDVLGNERHRPPNEYGSHEVHFAPGSMCASLLGERTVVNSLHHQGAASVGSLTPTGWATGDVVDGAELVEAVEDPSRRFAIGVQWHPEATSDWRLFAALVAAAREGDRDGRSARERIAERRGQEPALS
jgi:putative glutamine amidotransferase